MLVALLRVKELLHSLSNRNADGRILVDRYQYRLQRFPFPLLFLCRRNSPLCLVHVPVGSEEGCTTAQTQPNPKSQIRFLMLNPMAPFQGVVRDARAVVLAGGTMKPFEYVVDQLFRGVPASHRRTFECGHVIQPSNVLVFNVSRGVTKTPFEFVHKTRDDP